MSTPFKYLQKRDGIRSGGEGEELEASHLTDQLASIQLEDSCNQQVVQEMVARVQQSTSELEQLQTRLDTLQLDIAATTDEQDQELVSAVNNVDFVGLEAGRLEVERARLEAELGQALLRVQELEGGRGRGPSLGRAEELSGRGEAGESADLAAAATPTPDTGTAEEVRARAARVLAQYRAAETAEHEVILAADWPRYPILTPDWLLQDTAGTAELVLVVGELLAHSDTTAARARERVQEAEQQLEVGIRMMMIVVIEDDDNNNRLRTSSCAPRGSSWRSRRPRGSRSERSGTGDWRR